MSKSKKNKNQSSIKSKNANSRANKASLSRSPLDECVKGYAHTLLDPFSGPATCLPYPPSIPSMKMKVFARGTAYTGTNNVGFVSVKPTLAYDAANPNLAVCFTGKTFATNSISHTTATVGVTGVNFNSPFALADFSSDYLSWRIVSMGIRLKWVGTELDRGGICYALQHPDHLSLSGFNSATMGAFTQVQITTPVSGGWSSEVIYTPVAPADYDYTPTNTVSGDVPAWAILFTHPSVTGAGAYYFEVYMNVECIGRIVRGLSPSPSRVEATTDTVSAVNAALLGIGPQMVMDGVGSMINIASYVYSLYRRSQASRPQLRRLEL